MDNNACLSGIIAKVEEEGPSNHVAMYQTSWTTTEVLNNHQNTALQHVRSLEPT
jgi:hypothetical protein